jgi:hypothetical protein
MDISKHYCSQVCLALLFLSDTAAGGVLTLLMRLNGAAIALHLPATTGLLPQIVTTHELPAANALLATARSGAVMMEAALAGILVAGVGVGMTLLIDALSFGLSAWLIASLKPVPKWSLSLRAYGRIFALAGNPSFAIAGSGVSLRSSLC